MLLELNQKNAIVAGLRAIAQQGWGVPDKRPDWAHKIMSAGDNDSSLNAAGLHQLADLCAVEAYDVVIGPKAKYEPSIGVNSCYTYGLRDNDYHVFTPKGEFVCKAPHHIAAQEICDALDLAAANKAATVPPLETLQAAKPPKQLNNGGFVEATRNVLVPWYSEVGGDVSEITMVEGDRLACHWAKPAILFKRDDRYYIARPDEVRLIAPNKAGLTVPPGDDPTGEES